VNFDPQLAQLRVQDGIEELQRAAANLTVAIPGIEVQTYFVDFEGVWATHAPAAKEGPQRGTYPDA